MPEFPPLDPVGLRVALRAVPALFVVHAEDPGGLRRAAPSDRYADFVASRPAAAENSAVAAALAAARETGARVHILHLSSAGALPLLAAARAEGLPVTVETCPHYLTLDAGDVPDGATEFKCCPPIRDRDNRDALWQALAAGVIDCVVSDHSPSTLDLKDLENGDFGVAWGGISSLQLGLSLIWTEARRRGIGLDRVVEWMAARPAELGRLSGKGRIAVGYQADLAVFAPDQAYVVDPARLHHKNPITPYAQQSLTGVVRQTFLRGEQVDGRRPTGRLLHRGQHRDR